MILKNYYKQIYQMKNFSPYYPGKVDKLSQLDPGLPF